MDKFKDLVGNRTKVKDLVNKDETKSLETAKQFRFYLRDLRDPKMGSTLDLDKFLVDFNEFTRCIVEKRHCNVKGYNDFLMSHTGAENPFVGALLNADFVIISAEDMQGLPGSTMLKIKVYNKGSKKYQQFSLDWDAEGNFRGGASGLTFEIKPSSKDDIPDEKDLRSLT